MGRKDKTLSGEPRPHRPVGRVSPGRAWRSGAWLASEPRSPVSHGLPRAWPGRTISSQPLARRPPWTDTPPLKLLFPPKYRSWGAASLGGPGGARDLAVPTPTPLLGLRTPCLSFLLPLWVKVQSESIWPPGSHGRRGAALPALSRAVVLTWEAPLPRQPGCRGLCAGRPQGRGPCSSSPLVVEQTGRPPRGVPQLSPEGPWSHVRSACPVCRPLAWTPPLQPSVPSRPVSLSLGATTWHEPLE